ncbi:hypothetical protein BaRGS_00016718, partial [Batillaria attramentaria]
RLMVVIDSVRDQMGVNGQDVDLDRITMIPDVSPLPESCRKVALLSQGDTDGTLAPSA